MPRKNLIRTDQFPYHVTIRCNNKEWFDLPREDVWRYCISSIRIASKKYPVKIQAFVLMGNHYHLMIWTPNSDLDRFMYEMNRTLSKYLRQETRRINRIFGDRYKWSLIQNEIYYQIVLKYIYQNPVRAGISNFCEEYRFSTLYYFLNLDILPFELYNPTLGDKNEFLKWINNEYEKREREKIQKALKRPVFKWHKFN